MGAFLLMTMDDGKALEVDVVTVAQHWGPQMKLYENRLSLI